MITWPAAVPDVFADSHAGDHFLDRLLLSVLLITIQLRPQLKYLTYKHCHYVSILTSYDHMRSRAAKLLKFFSVMPHSAGSLFVCDIQIKNATMPDKSYFFIN